MAAVSRKNTGFMVLFLLGLNFVNHFLQFCKRCALVRGKDLVSFANACKRVAGSLQQVGAGFPILHDTVSFRMTGAVVAGINPQRYYHMMPVIFEDDGDDAVCKVVASGCVGHGYSPDSSKVACMDCANMDASASSTLKRSRRCSHAASSAFLLLRYMAAGLANSQKFAGSPMRVRTYRMLSPS
nr:MAG TPA: Tumor necrosis factor receptor superfamily, TWEAK, TNF Receptor, CRD [Caudoviricetes sp.]